MLLAKLARCVSLLTCLAACFAPSRTLMGQSTDVVWNQSFRADVAPLITKYCVECHSDELAEADINLRKMRGANDVRRSLKTWLKVRRILDSRQMPPPDASQPTDPERKAMLHWVRGFLAKEAQAQAGDPGPVVLRRLSNAEYNYTIRDLTGVTSLNPTAQFPIDGAAGEGFTNVGNGQGMSPALVQKYLDAGKQVANHLVLLPNGIRFAPHTTRRDETDRLLGEIRALYSKYALDSGSTTRLHGIKLRANEDGLLPVKRYLAALIEEHDALLANRTSLEDIARERGLSLRYLQTLRELFENKQPNKLPWLLRDLRKRYQATTPATVDSLANYIGSLQVDLTKFNPIGHIGREGGPTSWQEPNSTIVSRRNFSAPTPSNANDDVLLYLRAAPVGAKQGTVVWQSPRLEYKPSPSGWQPPAILLRDVRRVGESVRKMIDRENARTTEYLAAVARLHAEPSLTVNGVAKTKTLNAPLLEAWTELLSLARRESREIKGHFTTRMEKVSGNASINGWGAPATPSLLTNRSEKPIRLTTLTVPPRGVTVHPSPTMESVVAWKSPIAARVRIRGLVADADGVCGNGAAWRLERLSAHGKSTLASGAIDNGGREAIQLAAPVQVARGDVLQLFVTAKDRNHTCDTTHIEFRIEQIDGDQGTWDLAEQIVDDVLQSNPLPDHLGHPGVWHFCAQADEGASPAKSIIPSGSSLEKWREAVVREASPENLDLLAQQVQSALRQPAEAKPDLELRKRLSNWNGPLRWSQAAVVDPKPIQAGSHYGLNAERFGNHPASGKVGSNDLCLGVGETVTIRLPSWLAANANFTASAQFDPTTDSASSCQPMAAFTPLPSTSGLAPGEPVLAGDQARSAIEDSFAAFRSLFPRALCYRQIVPVDEVVTLTLFHREDEPLRRLMLNQEERKQLDRLWDELFFVSEEPHKKVVAYEQLSEFATQDRPDLVKAFAPLKPKLLARAKAFRAKQRAAEPMHVEAVLRFAQRAWRRPLLEAESANLRRLYSQLRGNDLPHEKAIHLTLARVLTSPAFLYKLESIADTSAPTEVSDYELASRLSYFLWSSAPDRTLSAVAAAGDLNTHDVLMQQTKRMLMDQRARRLAIQFACQWLHLRDFDQNDDKSEQRFPQFDALRGPMYEETVAFFTDMFANNGSILDLLEADHTFLNPALAQHYDVPLPDGVAAEQWVRVEGMQKRGRGGILGMASFLASQSGASRTSPILRGNWVFETLLGERLPRPPANVPQLPTDVPQGLTARQLIEKHSSAPGCAKCHAHIDPFGFALEQFDAIGRKRPKPADTRTRLANGDTLEGLDGLRSYLTETRREDVVRQFCRKLLGFALGREVQLSDEPLLDEILVKLREQDYRFHVAVEAIVLSPQFRRIRGRTYKALTVE